MEFTICEPILHNSAGRSFMNQVPFKIYRADFELKNGVLLAKYYYNKVNKKYKFHPRSQYSKPPKLYKFLNVCKTDCGILNLELNENKDGYGLWVIDRLLSDNVKLKVNLDGKDRFYSPNGYLLFENNKMYLNRSHRGDKCLEIKSLKVSICVINHTTVIGSGKAVVKITSDSMFPKSCFRYSKGKKALKTLLTSVDNEPERLIPLIEKALIGGYRKVAEDSEALQKVYKESYLEVR